MVAFPGRVIKGMLVGATAVALLLLGLAAPASAYRVEPETPFWHHWHSSTIRYYDASKFGRSVDDAARAWNRAKTGYVFKSVDSPNTAMLIITGKRDSRSDCFGTSYLGFTGREERMRLGGRCSGRKRTLVVAHEFGHVLGLGHDDSRCALMNTKIRLTAVPRPAKCRSGGTRRRMSFLRRDDFAGIAKIRRTGCPAAFPRRLPSPHAGNGPPPPPPELNVYALMDAECVPEDQRRDPDDPEQGGGDSPGRPPGCYPLC